MWAYYIGVVAIGISFLTIGFLWTTFWVGAGVGVFFGYRRREEFLAELRNAWQSFRQLNWRILNRLPKAAGKMRIEQARHRWMFPEPRLTEIRQEGFQALSESFLLLRRLVSYHSAALFEYDPDTRMAYPRIFSTNSESFRKDVILSVSDGVVGYSLSSGKIVHYADFKGDARLLGYYSSSEDIRSVIVLPLDRSDRRLGALVIDSTQTDAFSARQDEIKHLAVLFSELLVRVQREETLLVHLEEDRTLKAMTERMARAGVSIEEVAESLCTLAKEAFPADRVTFVVFDEVPGDPNAHAKPCIPSRPRPASSQDAEGNSKSAPAIVRFRSLKMLDRYVELVGRTRKTIRMDDVWENNLMSLATGQMGLSTHSILAAPFVFEGNAVGVVLLEADRCRAFNAFHETAIGELVSHAATAVARAIEYARMEKTFAIADVVPAAADKIFGDPSLDALYDLLKSRFGVRAQVLEVLSEKTGEVRIRPWEFPEPVAAASQFQKKALETGAALVRVDGETFFVRDIHNEIPAGADILFPLDSGAHAQRPFGLFFLNLQTPMRAESLQILERVRSLIQIRLILERRERQFGFLKQRDALTGVFHTAAFEKKLEERIRRSQDTSFYLVLIQPKHAALKRTHGHAETVRRYSALCSEIERLYGPSATVGRVGPEDIGVIWEGRREELSAVKPRLDRLSETLGFQIQVGSAEFPRDAETSAALIESAVTAVTDSPELQVKC